MMNTTSINNEYNDYYEDEVCNKDQLVKFGSIAIPVFFSVVIMLSLLGNVLVLVILAQYENLKSLTNIFILNLALSDLVFTTSLPFWAVYHIWGWVLGDVLCKTVVFIFFIGFYSSILFLAIMTIHRYLAVVYPLSDRRMRNVTYGIVVTVLLWAISIGAAMPSLLFSSVIPVHQKDENSLGCEYSDPFWKIFGTYQQNVFFLATFVIMGFCYVQILRKITKTKCHMKTRTVKLILCIVIVFFLGWVPYNVVIYLKILADYPVSQFDGCDVSTNVDYAFYVCRLIAFSHCCFNPVFYALIGGKFRSHLKTILHKIFGCKTSMEEQVRMENPQMH